MGACYGQQHEQKLKRHRGEPSVKLGIVTAIRGYSPGLEETLASVALSASRAKTVIEHVIVNGGPRDDNLDMVLAQIAPESQFWRYRLHQETDESFYEGLLNGFVALEGMDEGDWFGYLNAGDIWFPETAKVISALAQSGLCDWFTGTNTYLSHGSVPSLIKEPFRYKRHLLERGLYGRRLPGIQQESTYWSSHLHSIIDWTSVISCGVVGDADLWRQFAMYRDLYVVQALMGAFQMSGEHLSQSVDYRSELKRLDNDEISIARKVRDAVSVAIEFTLWRIQARRIRMQFEKNFYFAASTDGQGWFNGNGYRLLLHGA